MNKPSGFLNYFPYLVASKFDFFFEIIRNLENNISSVQKQKIYKPVFICGLARSGTTALLNALNKSDQAASFIYKDIPFFKTLITWNFFSNLFYKGVKPFKRLHGDGMVVFPKSPDAFEELIWRDNLENYDTNGIFKILTDKYENKKFEDFYKTHIKKVLLIRGNKKRYVSKGNYNILRIKYIKKIFPDARFVICFRNPFENAKSAINVHKNFLNQSKENKYFDKMLSFLCHFEFGNRRKSYKLDKYKFLKKDYDEDTYYYLNQWFKIYNLVLELYSEEKNIIFVDNRSLITDPNILEELKKKLELPDQDIKMEEYEAKKSNIILPENLQSVYLKLKELERRTLN